MMNLKEQKNKNEKKLEYISIEDALKKLWMIDGYINQSDEDTNKLNEEICDYIKEHIMEAEEQKV